MDADGAAEEMEDPEAVAKGICLRALTGTAKTRKQLAELLAKKGVPDAAAAAVLDRFTEVGLIDDAAFAAAWVTSRQSGRGLARRALAAELRAKGVDGDLAAAAVAEVDPQDEWDSARRLVERKVPAMLRLDRVTAERRLIGMLARKGYGGGLAGFVVREALDAAGAAEDTAEAEEDAAAAGADRAGAAEDTATAAEGTATVGEGTATVGEGTVTVGDPTDDQASAENAPVWTAARSAARATARAAAQRAEVGAQREDASVEVGEGHARPISRRTPPPHIWVDDLP